MAILNNSNAISSADGYDINNSLRFRSSASAYLSRTPGSTTNQKTWTWSAWVKVGALPNTNRYDLFDAGSNVAGNNSCAIYLGDNGNGGTNNLGVYDAISGSSTLINLQTTQVFRDPSAWYHIVVAVDTTQATSTNRVKVYVNGSQVTSFIASTYPSLNDLTAVNTNTAHTIGKFPTASANYLDGYLTEVNFIDGQALTPSSFGSTNALTGVWKPAKYTGTYGTNGFYLNFSNIALTSGSNTGLGKDYSGNGNYWNTNNISVTSGTTYDAMTDVPTLTSATVANYATLNPLLQNAWWASPSRGTITNGNLTHASGGNTTAFGNFDFVANSGKWYYEVTCGATDSNNTLVIAAQSRSTFEVGYYQSGLKQINSATPTSYGSSWTSGDVIGVAIDVPNNTITFYKNNVSQGAITNTFPTGQPVYGGSYYNTSSGDYNYNFGQRPFSYTPPSGYIAMNTYNLSTSTIVKGNSYMDATAYTGTNGSPTTQVISSNFQPDFLWFKKRSAAYDHALIDTTRGITKQLYSNLTNAEGTDSNVLTAIGASSFTVGNSNYSNYGTLVAWTWKANGGTTSSNTQGSITSTIQANTTAGFSIVTYTGTGANATVGHGLGVAPKMVIIKNRTAAATAWNVYQASIPSSNLLSLNSTAASFANTNRITAVSSTTFSIGTDSDVNGSTNSHVAYCWAEIAGFSKFGSYTGNGSTDGPFVYLGFRPKYLMIKVSSTTEDWYVWDSSRGTYNANTPILYPDLSAAESTAANDFLSNGFKPRTAQTLQNASGQTYIYAAFAENPFKNSLAR